MIFVFVWCGASGALGGPKLEMPVSAFKVGLNGAEQEEAPSFCPGTAGLRALTTCTNTGPLRIKVSK